MGQARILMIHHVTNNPQSVWEISPGRLKNQLYALLEEGHRFGFMDDVLHDAGNIAIVTFDDAYENVYRNAVPVLSALGIAATMYVPVDCVGGTNSFDRYCGLGLSRTERILGWPQLQELAGAGWQIQSHACSHAPLHMLPPSQIEDEVLRSKREIEDHTGYSVTSFCYPFGMVPGRDLLDLDELLKAGGYSSAVLAGDGPTKTPPRDPYRIPRMILTEEEGVA